MRLHSFDVFDTLLTRTVAVPADLFLEMGRDMRAMDLIRGPMEDFAGAREQVELEARRKTAHGEVNLDEIYEQLARKLGWDARAIEQIKKMELEWEERAIRAVPGMLERVERARGESKCVLFISDMYLPGDFIRARLRKEGFLKDDSELFLSNEHRISKGTGEMYEHIRAKLGPFEEWVHTGDQPKSDVEVPARMGIRADPYFDAHLNRYEGLARTIDRTTPALSRSMLSGAMRLTRLENPEQDEKLAEIWTTCSDMVGPLLFGFVHWCLEQASFNNLRRLYFVSRDGQILHQIAQKIVEAWGYEIECRYLYGSRQAWHPAAVGRLQQTDLEWILTPTSFLSVSRVFDRIGMKPEPFARELEAAGFSRQTWDDNLDREARARLGELILREPLKTAVEGESADKRALALEYMKQEGLLDGVPWAIVDIGWHGRLQDSLTKLLRRASSGVPARMTGFYFGLVGEDVLTSDQLRKGYWNDSGDDQRIKKLNWALIEMFTAADHGPVVGYEEHDGLVGPVLMRPKNDEVLKWGLEVQQRSVLRFTERLLETTERKDFLPIDFRAITEKLFDRFYLRPEESQARVWGSFPFTDDQYASSLKPFLPDWNCGEMVSAIFKRCQRPPFWWHEGSLALRPCLPLWLYVNLRRLKKSLFRG